MTVLLCFDVRTFSVTKRTIEDFRLIREERFTGIEWDELPVREVNLWVLQRVPGMWYVIPNGG